MTFLFFFLFLFLIFNTFIVCFIGLYIILEKVCDILMVILGILLHEKGQLQDAHLLQEPKCQ